MFIRRSTVPYLIDRTRTFVRKYVHSVPYYYAPGTNEFTYLLYSKVVICTVHSRRSIFFVKMKPRHHQSIITHGTIDQSNLFYAKNAFLPFAFSSSLAASFFTGSRYVLAWLIKTLQTPCKHINTEHALIRHCIPVVGPYWIRKFLCCCSFQDFFEDSSKVHNYARN